MGLFRVTVEILIEADDESEACDAVSETMRPLLHEFGGESFVDWRYPDVKGYPMLHNGAGFEYAPKEKTL